MWQETMERKSLDRIILPIFQIPYRRLLVISPTDMICLNHNYNITPWDSGLDLVHPHPFCGTFVNFLSLNAGTVDFRSLLTDLRLYLLVDDIFRILFSRFPELKIWGNRSSTRWKNLAVLWCTINSFTLSGEVAYLVLWSVRVWLLTNDILGVLTNFCGVDNSSRKDAGCYHQRSLMIYATKKGS